jgi:hypothetical protein
MTLSNAIFVAQVMRAPLDSIVKIIDLIFVLNALKWHHLKDVDVEMH